MLGKTILLAGAMMMADAAPAADREVTIPVVGGSLGGTLVQPEVAKPGPAVLLIAGSGPTDRDGNSYIPGVRPATQKWIADGLAAAGIASLRYDKRGLGGARIASFDEAKLRFSDYVDDAVAAAKLLGEAPGVRCVILAGHSEGALIALLAAQRMPVCGVILLAGSARRLDATLVDQFAALPEKLRVRAIAAVHDLAAGKPVDLPDMPALFRPAIQPFLMSLLAIDPVEAAARVHVPLLIVQGTTDLQIAPSDAELFRHACPDATLLVLEGTNHVMKTAPDDRAANIATYADPALPIDARLVPAVVTFVDNAKWR